MADPMKPVAPVTKTCIGLHSAGWLGGATGLKPPPVRVTYTEVASGWREYTEAPSDFQETKNGRLKSHGKSNGSQRPEAARRRGPQSRSPIEGRDRRLQCRRTGCQPRSHRPACRRRDRDALSPLPDARSVV